MRNRNSDTEIFRLALIGAILALLCDVIDILILCKEFSRNSGRQRGSSVIVDELLF